jgi:hypothetical protein
VQQDAAGVWGVPQLLNMPPRVGDQRGLTDLSCFLRPLFWRESHHGREETIMANRADMETRLRLLEKDSKERGDIDDIKRVKYKYWRSLDQKLFDELGECFTKDATADYGPKWRFQNRSAILAFLEESMERFVSVHHGHNPEIELTGDKTARGTWALYNYMIDKQSTRRFRIGGYYRDEYRKEKGKWKISRTQEINLFREILDEER